MLWVCLSLSNTPIPGYRGTKKAQQKTFFSRGGMFEYILFIQLVPRCIKSLRCAPLPWCSFCSYSLRPPKGNPTGSFGVPECVFSRVMRLRTPSERCSGTLQLVNRLLCRLRYNSSLL